VDQLERFLAPLRDDPIVGYLDEGPPATEVTAIAALALAVQNCWDSAQTASDWLKRVQASRGSVGISPEQGEPCWGTGWAVIAWSVLRSGPTSGVVGQHLGRAVDWILLEEGLKEPRVPELGHDPSLSGWPWVSGTHAWIEPTAINLLALRHVGLGQHDRARQAVALLLDRQLPDGGCNYGNTQVLGRSTLPHVQPTALSLLALSAEPPNEIITRSLYCLETAWPRIRGLISLCYAALALSCYRTRPVDLEARISTEVCSREYAVTPYLRALSVLALSLPNNPLIPPSPHGPAQDAGQRSADLWHGSRTTGQVVQRLTSPRGRD
jgi:hypothetical protein